jgi:alpha-glucoside transport system substrate-binding protein
VRRRASAGALCLALIALGAGCSSAPPQSLSVYGPYVGPEADLFADVIAEFERETGTNTTYVGSANFQSEFTQRLRDLTLPDIVVLPQPALLTQLLDGDHVAPLSPDVAAKLQESIGPALGAATVSAIPYRFVVKSLVWYRSDVFANRGYAVPSTLAELDELVSRMISDGQTPWCSGMDDSSATGWWATDWIEDLVLRRAGAGTYQSWATLTTPFTDNSVETALREFQGMVQMNGAFRGGSRGVLTTAVSQAMNPMFGDQPGCLMHKQASFEPIWFPRGAAYGSGGLDVFPLPSLDGSPPPLVISGEIVAATSNNPAAQRFLSFLLDPAAFDPWSAEGGSITLLTDRPQPRAGSLDARLYEIIDAAPVAVFDASDQMPSVVGTGSFFRGMVDLVGGVSPDSVAEEIQATVPSEP